MSCPTACPSALETAVAPHSGSLSSPRFINKEDSSVWMGGGWTGGCEDGWVGEWVGVDVTRPPSWGPFLAAGGVDLQ